MLERGDDFITDGSIPYWLKLHSYLTLISVTHLIMTQSYCEIRIRTVQNLLSYRKWKALMNIKICLVHLITESLSISDITGTD